MVTAKLIKELDLHNVYGSVTALPDQIKDGWHQALSVNIPKRFSQCKNIVFCGMGGSALGGRLIKSLELERLRIPLEIVNDYHLPAYVGSETLVIVDSYSGNTEETLAGYEEARKKEAQILTISAGGKLAEFSRSDGETALVIEPTYNPSNQPRMAVGYSVSGVLGLLAKIKLIDLTTGEMEKAVGHVRKMAENYKVEKEGNAALLLSQNLVGKIPVLVASEHLFGAVHTTKNQLNENAKTFSAGFPIPELNHHLLEGLQFPATNKTDLFFIFCESGLYHPRTQKRYLLTEETVRQNSIPYSTYTAQGETRLEQAFELIQFGGFVSFYLSMLNGINPAPIPFVDWFKEEMEK